MKKLKPNTIYYTVNRHNFIMALIPKRKGFGFLRSPIYHQSNELSSFIMDEYCLDADGLDGYLNIEASHKDSVEDIINGVNKFLGFKNTPEEMAWDFWFKILGKHITYRLRKEDFTKENKCKLTTSEPSVNA